MEQIVGRCISVSDAMAELALPLLSPIAQIEELSVRHLTRVWLYQVPSFFCSSVANAGIHAKPGIELGGP